MITLKEQTVTFIKQELESIPEKYQKPFNSMHEGLAILREEYLELEQEIFWGEKKVKKELDFIDNELNYNKAIIEGERQLRVRAEAIQVAAMAARIIQELT